MTVILDNSKVTSVYEEETVLIYDIYKVDIDLETIQESLNTGIEHLKEHGGHKWLTDTRAIAGFGEAGAQWVLGDWGPRAVESGWEYWALIVPEAMEGRVAMVQFVSAFAAMGVKVRVFTDENTAREWLATV